MAIYRSVQVGFWKDPKILEEFTPEDKLFFLYLMTNPNTTQIGIYKITKKQIAFEMGYSIESVNSIMERFINNHKLIKYNEETREIGIKHWGRYNLNKGGKPVMDCINKEIKEVKDKTLLNYISHHIKKEDIKMLFELEYTKGEGKDGKYSYECQKHEYASTHKGKDDKSYEKPSDEQIKEAGKLLRQL